MLRRYVGLMVFVLAIVMLMPAVGMAEAATATPTVDTGGAVVEIPGVEVGEPLTWTYLATIAGAAAFTLLVVQFLKAPLDKVWKIPTRVLLMSWRWRYACGYGVYYWVDGR